MYTVDYFENYTVRKAVSWDEIPIQNIPDKGMNYLSQKRVFITTRNECPTPFDMECTKHGLPREFVIQMLGGSEVEWYYVDTQGYDYARYTFRYVPRDV